MRMQWLFLIRSKCAIILFVFLSPSRITAATATKTTATTTASSSSHHRRLIPNYPGDNGQRRQVEVPVPTDPEDHRVVNLPLDDGSLKTPHYAGLLPASSKNDKYLFYWLFYPDMTKYHGKEEDIPLLVWLNGGPGCSSMDGLFIEHGPLELVLDKNNHWKITSRDKSWHKSPAYVVYIDQPVGTGISFTTSNSYPSNDNEVNADFYYWLKQFLSLHSNVFLSSNKKKLKRPFFFSGESHAGHYIPSMMAYIERQNELSSTTLKIAQSGAAIGNGWVDPYHQYAAAAAAYGHGLIGRAQQNALDAKEKECQANLDRKNLQSGVCMSLLDDLVDQSFGKSSKIKVSQYDIRKQESKHAPRVFPPGHKVVEGYLGGWLINEGIMTSTFSQVLAAIHATPSRNAGQEYQECTDPPYNALAHQDGLGVMEDVKYLLGKGIRLLFFNGVMDLICNHVGNELMLDKMEWTHQNDYVVAPRYAWMSSLDGKKLAGYMKEYKNLSFLKLLECGHMAPLDQPTVCLDMMITFMYSLSFQSSEQSLARSPEPTGLSCPVCPECKELPIIEDTSKPAEEPLAQDASLMKSIVEQSWLAAVVGVILVLLFVFCTTMRSASRLAQIPVSRSNNGSVYSDLEMKVTTNYQDDVVDEFHDEDNDAAVIAPSGSRII